MAKTIDDLYNILEQIARNGAFSGGGGASGTTGGSRRHFIGELESLDEIKEKYNEATKSEIEHFEAVKSTYAEAEEYLNTHSQQYDEILDKKRMGIDLTEDEEEVYSKARESAKAYGESLSYLSKNTRVSAFTKSLDQIGGSIKGMYSEIQKLTDPWAKVDKEASKYAKTIGMTQKGMNALRDNTIKNVTSNKLAAKYNISNEELVEAQLNYVKGSGRAIRVSDKDQENIAAMKFVTGEKGNDIAAQFDSFGISMSSTADRVGKMFAEASKEGLSFEKYSENVSKNIKMAQNYTFKNGTKGLESMAKKATAIKMDMQQIAAFADKIGTVESSIETSAKLQVLGGPFASIADPMGMLNEGLNDMEGLQDRIAKMVGSLGYFDKTTGEVNMSSFNKKRVKAAAEATGISYDALMDSAFGQARRGEIESQIKSSTNAQGLSSDMIELIKNSGTIENGKAGVTIDGKFKNIDELTNDDFDALKAETNSEEDNIRDIAVNLKSLVDNREGFSKQTEAYQARMFSLLGRFEKWVVGLLGTVGLIHMGIVGFRGLRGVSAMIDNARGVGQSGRSIFRAAKNMRGLFSRAASGSANAIDDGDYGEGLFDEEFESNRKGKKRRNKKARGKGRKKFSKSRGAKGKVGKLKKGLKTLSKGKKSIGNIVSKVGKKGVGKAITSTATKAVGGNVVKGGLKRTATRGAIKVLGKSGAKTALGMGARLAGGVAKGGPLGIVGAVGNIATDALVESGKIEKGGVGHHIGKGLSGAASGAALGMMIGSVIPGVGTAIGGAIGAVGGAVVGLVQAGKAKQERLLEAKTSQLGIEVKGKYGRGKLKSINEALDTGKISKRMRKKLEANGDFALLAQIDKVGEKKKKEKEEKADKRHKRRTELLSSIFSGGSSKFGTADITVGTAKFGGKGVDGLFNAVAKARKGSLISNMASKIKGKVKEGIRVVKENGKLSSAWESITPKKEKSLAETNAQNTPIIPKSFDININGSLKLVGDAGQSVDIIKMLKDNPIMLRNIADMIASQMKYNNKGVNQVDKVK